VNRTPPGGHPRAHPAWSLTLPYWAGPTTPGRRRTPFRFNRATQRLKPRLPFTHARAEPVAEVIAPDASRTAGGVDGGV
jgi:hypothetical protein